MSLLRRTISFSGLIAITATLAAAQTPIAPCPMGPVPPAGPIPGENPTPSCRIGDFEFIGFTDFFSPIGPFSMNWSIEFFPTRIDLALRMVGSSVTLTTPVFDPIDSGFYPFFEYKLFYQLNPLTPTARVFRAAMTGLTGTAEFNVPDYSYSGPYANWSSGFSAYDNGTWGVIESSSYFENFTQQPVIGTFRDISISASIWLDQPVTPVPEPATLTLFGSGLLCLGLVGFRKRRHASISLPDSPVEGRDGPRPRG